MLHTWLIPLLSINDVGEFLFVYNTKSDIRIHGVLKNGEWVVNIRVKTPGFIWGCNEYHTGIQSKGRVLKYLIVEIINQMAEYRLDGKEDLLSVLKGDLE